MSSGIDGRVELNAALDRLSAGSAVAATAPRAGGLFRYLERGMAAESMAGEVFGPYWLLTRVLIEKLSIWWHPSAVEVLPVMVPWCIRDRSARYDQGPEMWGSPRADGCFRDDNSIIKKLPLPLTVDAGPSHPVAGRRANVGYTACHIWRDLEDGTAAGEDPWLYSFMPNLVWLPTPLAPLTDHHPRVQALLKTSSHQMYGDSHGIGTSEWVDRAWDRLVPSGVTDWEEGVLDLGNLALFRADYPFVTRRLAYIERFAAGADEVLASGRLARKLVSSRYTAGLPAISRDALESFRDGLTRYAAGVRLGVEATGLSKTSDWPGAGSLVVAVSGL